MAPHCFPSQLGCEKGTDATTLPASSAAVWATGASWLDDCQYQFFWLAHLGLRKCQCRNFHKSLSTPLSIRPTGTTWQVHTSTDFGIALHSAHAGNTIVLDAGSNYTAY